MKNRRRRHHTARDFQLRIIISYVLSCLAAMTLSPVVFYLLVSEELDALKWKMTFRVDPAAEIIFPALLSASFIAVIFIFVTVFIISRHLSGKTARSLEKIIKDLETASGGNLLLPVIMNDAHFFHDFSKELSFMVVELNKRFKKMHQNFTVLKHEIDSLPDIKEELLPKKCSGLKKGAHEMRKASEITIHSSSEKI